MTLARDALGQWVYPVHRLDRGTSGALLFALSSEVAAACQRSFQAGLVDKRYLALTRGAPRPREGTLDHPLPSRAEGGGERVPARTRYRVAEVVGRYALVEAWPETGRLHQIRRHLKHLSCPLIGDVKYGKGEHNRRWRSDYGLHRLGLHAAELRLPHPVTGEALVVVAGLPDDLAEPLLRAGFHLPPMAGRWSEGSPPPTGGG